MKDVFIPDFILVPKEAYHKEGLTLVDGSVYGVIYWYHSLKEGRCFASNESIGTVIGVGGQKVSEAIKKLENAGLVHVIYKDKNKRTRLEIIPLLTWGLRQAAYGVTPHGVTGVTPHGVQKNNNLINNKEEILASETLAVNELILKGRKNKELAPKAVSIIKAFEAVDPKNRTYYNNVTQGKAALFLADEYGYKRVVRVIELLPKTNTIPHFPKIYTPHELKERWQALSDAFIRKKGEKASKGRGVVNKFTNPNPTKV
jgi:hypothetical protein